MSKLSLNTPRFHALRTPILERDGYQCVQCGSENNLTLDHILPMNAMTPEQVEEGMPYDPDNLQTLCRTCNGRKQDKRHEFKQYINDRWLIEL